VKEENCTMRIVAKSVAISAFEKHMSVEQIEVEIDAEVHRNLVTDQKEAL